VPAAKGGPLWVSANDLAANPDLLSQILPVCEELHARNTSPAVTYKPDHSKDRNQLGFHSSHAAIRIAEGGNQSGKSKAGAHEIYWTADGTHPYLKTPSNPKIYILSAEYRTIQEGIWKHLRGLLWKWKIIKFGPPIPRFNIPSYIHYEGEKGFCQIEMISSQGGEAARRKVQSADVDLVVVDEEIDESLWNELMMRRLVRGGKVIITATAYRSEPWLLELEDRAESGDPRVELFRFDTYAALRAGHIDRETYDEIEQNLTSDEKAVRLRGLSRRHQGLVYGDFGQTHVCDPFEIPKDWDRYCAIDPGHRTAAVLWLAISPNDKHYIYRALYFHGTHIFELADRVFLHEHWVRRDGCWVPDEKSEKLAMRWIDPSEFGTNPTGDPKSGNLLASYGMPCVPAINDVEYGINLCQRTLMAGLDGTPQLRVFRDCTLFLKEIRSYRRVRDVRDGTKAERSDKPVKRNDHLLDCWRYIIAGQPEYRTRSDPYLRQDWSLVDTSAPPVPFTGGMEERYKKHWQNLIRRQRLGNRYPSGSGYGLGSER